MKVTRCIIALAGVVVLTGCHNKQPQIENIVTVKTATASSAALGTQQNYAGSIEEQSGTMLSFATAGTIKALSVHEGQNVSAGQLLGVVDATTTGSATEMARAATQQARETLAQAQDAYNRMKLLHDNGSLPEIRWVEVETQLAQARQMLAQAQAAERIARKGLADTRLTAPFSGYIARKVADAGQNVVPGQAVVNLVKIDQVKVKISVPEEEIAKIRMGQRVMFRVASLGNATFFGKVSEKSIAADPISRSYTVKAMVPNAGHRLLPGMVCDVYTSIDPQTEALSLPANLIQIDIDNRPFVWTVADGKARKVKVVLGENVGENVIIKAGIQQGDQVIVAGQQKVSQGQKVKTEK